MAFVISMNAPLRGVAKSSNAFIYCIVPESWVLSGNSGITIHNKQRDIILDGLKTDIQNGDTGTEPDLAEMVHVVMDTDDSKYKGYWKRLLLDSASQAKGSDKLFYASVNTSGEMKRFVHDDFIREIYERN